MNFKATLTFICDGNPNSDHIDHLRKKMSCEIERIKLQCRISETVEESEKHMAEHYYPVEYHPDVSVTFHISREIRHLSSLHYVSMILQGFAGLHLLNEGVYSFSYKILSPE